MCGIIGRISLDSSPQKTLLGLKELEYRGYDSYGILVGNVLDKDVGEIKIAKIEVLNKIKSQIELGHTRWATHGRVVKENAHPHFDQTNKFFVVMNGIVENYNKVKKELNDLGYAFNSQTDTEVIPQLFLHYFDGNLRRTLKKVLLKLKGDFSFLLKYDNIILGYKNINPIIIGKSENEIFVSSDSNLVQKNSENYYTLDDGEFFISTLDENLVTFEMFDKNFNKKNIEFKKSAYSENDDIKETDYFMQKEILEQKDVKKLLTQNNLVAIENLIKICKTKKVFLVGAGTSYNAANFMHYILLKNNIFSNLILASELSNYINLIEDSLIVVFSQSGETADLIYPLKSLKINNQIITITNTPNSTLDRFSENSIYLNCGREVSVASTKAFVFQVYVSFVLDYLINFDLEKLKSMTLLYENFFEIFIESSHNIILDICSNFSNSNSVFFIGRNQYFPFAVEGALKLKEISYIHAEGFAGGELKHGSLALIEKNTLSIVLGTDSEVLSNAQEIKTRGGILVGISNQENEIFDYHIKIPKFFEEIFSTIVVQKLALEMTLQKGYNPDKPRNLAKSVTVK